MTIKFDVQSKEFSLKVSGNDKEYRISHVVGVSGPIDIWDLHVGAKLDLLGKATTLMQASLKTSAWNEEEGRRLMRLHDQLCAELHKYGVQAPGASTRATPVVFREKTSKGGVRLKVLIGDIARLYELLRSQRPQRAAEWLQQFSTRATGSSLSAAASSREAET